MTTTEPAVIRVNGTCGKTVRVNVFAAVMEISCLQDEVSRPTQPPVPLPLPTQEPFDPRLFDVGSGGGVATIMGKLRGLSAQSEADDNLFVVTSDGRVSTHPDDYQAVVDTYAPHTASSSLTLNIGPDIAAMVNRAIDPSASPVVIVCPAEVESLGSGELGMALSRAAEVHAPIHVLAL